MYLSCIVPGGWLMSIFPTNVNPLKPSSLVIPWLTEGVANGESDSATLWGVANKGHNYIINNERVTKLYNQTRKGQLWTEKRSTLNREKVNFETRKGQLWTEKLFSMIIIMNV